MKTDEFAFFNQQLAAMLRDGIPLEGALRRLCAEMRHSPLRTELEKLEADLARGTPLAEAVRARQLPELYQCMLEVGALGNDLPGVLTLLADHYQRTQAIWTRLKGLMVYPAIVLAAALLLACFLGYLTRELTFTIFAGTQMRLPDFIFFGPWIAPVLVGLLAVVFLVAIVTPGVRQYLRWRVPAFREAGLAQIASAFSLMLRSGVPLDQALDLIIRLEHGTRAEKELASDGAEKFLDAPTRKRFGQSGEDLATGFQRVSESCQTNAAYRTELMLYSALPCAVLVLGVMIVMQFVPILMVLIHTINALSGD